MLKRSLYLLAALFAASYAKAQEKWDLRKCVEYALANNITIRQTDLQSGFSELTLVQSKAAKWPSLNFQGSGGLRFGRSENPTTGVFEDANFRNMGMQMQSQVSLFNWFSQRNTIEANRLTWEADKEQTKKVKDDIALNVAVAYLQVLLAREQANIVRVQLAQTREQLFNTRKRVDAGALPELNAVELEAQYARDSSSLVTAESSVKQFNLQLKALLTIDAAAAFEIETPPVDQIPVEPLADLQPEAVYALATSILPQQKVNILRLQSALKSVEAAKGNLYPTISAFGSLGTNAIFFENRPVYDQVLAGHIPSDLRADAGGGVFFPVEIPTYQQGTTVIQYIKPDAMGSQLWNNFGQSIGIGLSVPIFNGRSARTAWDRSKLTVKQMELNKQLGDLTLKQDIYAAYNDAVAALQKFNADKKSVETAQKSYEFAQKRYDLTLLSTFDLINSQNNLLTAKIQALYSQYDYVFKIKLLEFYRGQGIKL